MAFIKLDGEQYELKFTYLSLHAIEQHYKQGVFKVFREADLNSLDTINTFIWACLRKERKLKNKTPFDIAVMIDNSIENEETTLEELAQALEEGFQNSTILKSAIEEQSEANEEGTEGNE